MVSKIIGAQRDFSFGEIDVALKRSDEHPARKGGLRQMANARILNSGAVQNRSGRRALYPITSGQSRVEELTLSSGNIFKIQFGPGFIEIINSAGAAVATFLKQGNGAALPWVSHSDIASIVYAPFNLTITLCFGHSMRPQVITWDGFATWSIADYIELVTASGQKRTPFYRLSPQNVTLNPTNVVGAIQVNFSSDIVQNGMVGTRVRFAGRQILLQSVVNSRQMNALVIETLPAAQELSVTGGVGSLSIGDVIEGGTSGAVGIVCSTDSTQTIEISTAIFTQIQAGDAVTGVISGATGIVTAILSFDVFNVQLSTGTAFAAGEIISGPNGSVTAFGVSPLNIIVQLIQESSGNAQSFIATERVATPSYSATVSSLIDTGPQAISVWDDEVMNNFRGYPASCFVDQFRLGFCDFPALPNAICWSAINSASDIYTGANPSDSIFELAPNKVRVLYVVPGPESSEFVFCDTRVYYIPISAINPLKPGSVAFQILSGDGAAPVQPRLAQEAILYANAGQNSIFAVIATGAYNRPFNTKNLSEFHQHLFSNVQAIAVPNADGTFLERYAYVLNGDGSIAVGKYNTESLQGSQPVIGWGPWSGAATVSWIAAWNSDVIFTSKYFGVGICEVLDDTKYLDFSLPVNALPATFTPPAGKGPLWLIGGQAVTLMDQVTRAMGTYQIDANGFIIPQNSGGENLAIASLVAGQPWKLTVEPFCPDASPGNDIGQRMFKRRISRFAAYVINSTGFLMVRLFSGPITQTSPPLGTVMNRRRVTTWNQGDDATKPPPLREEAQRWRPIGRAFDPRVAIIKDTPGPLLIAEIGIEATI